MQKKKTQHLGVSFNAPATLTYALICGLILILQQKTGPLILFTAPASQNSSLAFNWKDPLHYLRLVLHIFGHTDWNHLITNLSFLLLLGPLLEERFSSQVLILMSATAAFVTGTVNACFIPWSLCGSSGIVFMMILLSSYTNIDKSSIPLSFILVCLLYFGKEMLSMESMMDAGISALAQIIGGICGSLFVVFGTESSSKKKTTRAKKSPPEPQSPEGDSKKF